MRPSSLYNGNPYTAKTTIWASWRHKSSVILIKNTKLFIHENASGSIVHELAAILSGGGVQIGDQMLCNSYVLICDHFYVIIFCIRFQVTAFSLVRIWPGVMEHGQLPLRVGTARCPWCTSATVALISVTWVITRRLASINEHRELSWCQLFSSLVASEVVDMIISGATSDDKVCIMTILGFW